MNAKEKRQTLVTELDGLVDGVKAGDADAIKRADEIVAELEQVDELLEKASEKASTLEALGKTSAPKTNMKGAQKMSNKNYTDEFVDALKSANLQPGEKRSVVVDMKAATDTVVTPNPGEVDYLDRVVAVPNGRLGVRDLLPTELVSTGTFGYMVVETEGAPDEVAEDGAKPQMSATTTLKTASVKTIGAIMKITDEMRQDYPRLVSMIQNRLIYNWDLAEEEVIITDLLSTTGIGADTYAQNATAQDKAEAIFSAAMSIKDDTGYDADAVIMNVADFEELRLAKDSNLQYFGGGMFEGQYGTDFNGIYPRLWGMIVVVSKYITAGTIVVGAFRQSAAVAVRGARELALNYDGVDFSHDRSTLRIAGREALEVFVPAGFVVLTEAE